MGWFPDWAGWPAVIVASGPSAKAADLSAVKGQARIIAVNESWRLCPSADVLYGCDAKWWRLAEGAPDFAGLKISIGATPFADVRQVATTGRHAFMFKGERVGSGGNSGFQAVNLAILFGSRRIVLVGFDYTVESGVHWHGRHPAGLNNPSERQMGRWRDRLDATAPALAAKGVEIINASSVSTLRAFPKRRLEDLFSRRAAA